MYRSVEWLRVVCMGHKLLVQLTPASLVRMDLIRLQLRVRTQIQIQVQMRLRRAFVSYHIVHTGLLDGNLESLY